MEHRDQSDETPDAPPRPPGQFMDEQLAADTARFLAEVKRLAERRAIAEAERDRL